MFVCLFLFIFSRFLSVNTHPCIHGDLGRKWTAVAFMLIIQSFYLVQVNTHTDFGDLMQQLDHRTWERMRELFINRKWHHCTTGSAKAVVWRLGSQYHKKNASSALLVIWYLLRSRAMWRKMVNERLRALVVVKYWNLGPIHWACHCCFGNN